MFLASVEENLGHGMGSGDQPSGQWWVLLWDGAIVLV